MVPFRDGAGITKFTLFIPTYNEIIGSREIMPKIKREWADEIIVVDAGSTDGTQAYYRELGCKVIEQKERGLCAAYWECLAAATGDVIIAFSPDGNSVPERIPALIEKMKEGYDMVIVSRYADGAKSDDDDGVTSVGNWLFTKSTNLFFGGNYTDVLVMFRAFRKDLIERLDIRERKYPVLELILAMRCARRGLKTADIPGDEPPRIGGKRKMRVIYNGCTLLWTMIKDFSRF